ncbi:S41 family peptidase [Luteolibacter sp. AS25]|uniref:S41 family peptidase n=1 Tax=Luteolibacter sp. AS25 TaxID=3135776 RepID=UPI00398ABAC8
MRLFAIFLLGTLSSYSEIKPSDPDDAAYPALERFVEVLEAARARHPDVEKVTYDRMINHALDGMLSSLDSHSSFIYPEMQQLVDKDGSLDNEVRSLGLSLGRDSERIFIAAIEKHGPAATAGIPVSSTLFEINGAPAQNLTLTDALAILNGAPGAKTTLTLSDPERPGELKLTVIHRYVENRSLIVSAPLEDHPDTGYLRLAQFGPNCAGEVESALDELEDNGMASLILDLRGNGGGDLHQTVRILGLFLPPSTKVVSVRERGKAEEFLETPARQRRKRDYKICVLIDRNSASASELTAGALHDLKRATVIGEKSYGKGSVQNIVPMGGNTALRLTIATYHTPSGNTPHLKGIKPDIQINFTGKDRENFSRRGRVSSLGTEQLEELSKWQDPAIVAAVKAME